MNGIIFKNIDGTELVVKFNPYHDNKGQFTSRDNHSTFSPGSSPNTAQMSIQRENERRVKEGLEPVVGGKYQNIGLKSHSQALADRNKYKEEQEKSKETQKSAINDKERAALTAVESKIANLKREQLHLIDEHGDVILKLQGSKSSVKFGYNEAQRMADRIVTHNHPSGSTFSYEDINTFIKHDLKAIRATGKYGTYSLEKTDKSNKNFSSEARKKYNEVQNNIAKNEVPKLQKSVNEGKLSVIDANEQIKKIVSDTLHNWNTENAPKYGYKYTFEEKVGKMIQKEKGKENIKENEGEIDLDGEFNRRLENMIKAPVKKELIFKSNSNTVIFK